MKGIAGFYYVHVKDRGVYECKAKGIFRNRNVKPLVGDDVMLESLDEANMIGNITEILPRKNELIRPASANIDQAVIIFALKNPEPNFDLLNRFLVYMSYQDIPVVICFNKADLVDEATMENLRLDYENCGCKVIFTSTKTKQGLDTLLQLMEDKTTVLAGPSGVGKSTFTNLVCDARMETGDVSKIGRGRHTTRHSEIFHLHGATYLFDTPGFTSLICPSMEKEDLRFEFAEFTPYEGKCRFNGCVHVNEPDCAVKEALAAGTIRQARYEGYLSLYEELKNVKKY